MAEQNIPTRKPIYPINLVASALEGKSFRDKKGHTYVVEKYEHGFCSFTIRYTGSPQPEAATLCGSPVRTTISRDDFLDSGDELVEDASIREPTKSELATKAQQAPDLSSDDNSDFCAQGTPAGPGVIPFHQ